MDVVVTGIGLQSCLGSLTESWTKIVAGESGISFQQPFRELAAYPLGLIASKPGNLAFLTKSIVTTAIKDAGLQLPLRECGVAVGSSRGCQNLWEEIVANRQNKLENWLDTLPHNSAVTTAQLIGTIAPVLSPMAACATGIHAIARGYELIQTGECQRVIAGAIETPITPLSLAGFERMGALAKTGCYPFDRQREGLVLAEGGAVFVLETAALARRRQARIYSKIAGFGLTCDSSSLTAPETSSRSSAIALKNCLTYSDLNPNDIDYIHAHGTSTILNDRHEAKLIARIFNHPVAVSSTKGATGHTLGASGALGVAWCLLAMQSGYLPPCVGLTEPDFELNLVRETRRQVVNNALCFSFGFGGQNAILALSNVNEVDS